MLETVDLSQALTKEEFKKKAPPLREKLRRLQYECKDAEIPIIIVFEGWDAAGKGRIISRLLERIDPRGFKVHPARPPTTEEEAKPFLWRHWVRLPQDGEIALFDRSWYGRVLIERVAKMVPKKVWQRAFEEISQFERQLAEDGAVIVKFFLHISKKEQRRRLKKLEKDKFQSWRVTKWDWKSAWVESNLGIAGLQIVMPMVLLFFCWHNDFRRWFSQHVIPSIEIVAQRCIIVINSENIIGF